MAEKLKLRKDVAEKDTWDLTDLYEDDKAWEADFVKWSKAIEGYKKYKGTLGKGEKYVLDLLEFDAKIERNGENLGNYAFLKSSQDEGNADYQRMKGRFQHGATRQSELASSIRPELLSLSESKLASYVKSPLLKGWSLALDRVARYKSHSLSENEEALLAMQAQVSAGPNTIFSQLTDVDIKWGTVKDEKGKLVEVCHSVYQQLLQSPVRSVRKDVFHEYFKSYEHYKNTLAAAYNTSVQNDVYHARVRKYPGALDASLFKDDIKKEVYTNLINVVHGLLPELHRYLRIRKQQLKVKDIHHYDLYVTMFSDASKNHTWQQAVDETVEATKILGEGYTSVLEKGLTTDRWCDRYPNKGKHSGAFSSGSYDSRPYILMNFSEKVLDNVFTLAHEAGHSMHTHLAKEAQPFQYAGYPIFTAEIASTFNEQLLLNHMLKNATKKERLLLLEHAIDSIRTTIIRQTMFAEFEMIVHEFSEKGEPLTAELLKNEYSKLLKLYFGSDFVIDPELEIECLRIPHFYRAFYVYKYATGLISSIALSQRVLNGAEKEREAYLDMLRAGSSDWPLDLLKKAGLDLTKKESLAAVGAHFKNLIDQLEKELK